jgi:hypothetical protein
MGRAKELISELRGIAENEGCPLEELIAKAGGEMQAERDENPEEAEDGGKVALVIAKMRARRAEA